MNEYQPEERVPAPEGSPKLPSFFVRPAMVVFQPADLFQALANRPVWFPMLAFAALAAGSSMLFVPGAVWEQTMSAAGPEAAEAMGGMGAAVMRVFSPFAAAAAIFGSALFLTAVSFVAFVFIRGDEAKFRQYLSIFAHTAIIGALGAYVYLPFRLRSEDLQLTFSVGTFMPFLGEGYLANVFQIMDLFGLWTVVVAALGISLLDERRRWGSTAVVAVALLLVVPALVFALIPTFFG